MSAIINHRNDEIIKLLDEGADPNFSRRLGYTAITMAIKSENNAALKMLLNKNANPDHYDDLGQTPLISAAGDNRNDAIAILINAGADVSLRDRQNDSQSIHYSALLLSTGFGYIDCVKALIQADHSVDHIEEAILEAKSHDKDDIAMLLSVHLENKKLNHLIKVDSPEASLLAF